MTRGRTLAYWILGADLAWVGVAMALACIARYGQIWRPAAFHYVSRSFGLELAALLLWFCLSSWKKLDGFSGGWWLPAVVSQVSVGVGTLMVLLLAGEYMARNYVSRLLLIYFGVLLVIGFVGIRYVIHRMIVARRHSGTLRRIVIVGHDRVAAEMASKIQSHPEMRCEVIGFLYPLTENANDGLTKPEWQVSTVQTLEIADLLRTHKVDELILTDPQPADREILNLVARCRSVGIQVSLVPHLYELYLSMPDVVDVGGLPVLRFQQPRESPLTLAGKRAMDLVFGGLLLVIGSPLILAAALILRLEKGQAFRRELRCGQNGRKFWMCRLNVQRGSNDLSRRERFLDALSITELPNLLNVLRGEMSLVGPRPESFDRAERYSDWTRQRLNNKPGITGLAQVHGLREQHSSEEKAYFDLQYSLQRSLFADFSLVLQTVWTLLARVVRRSSRPAPPSAQFNYPMPEVWTSANSSQSSAD